tara:strand:- start:285 stop:602 length:318 start_codon:yes stop_codon:yes gene_type:complete
LGLTFFGLTPSDVPQARAAVFTQIHEIVFHGKGGYSWYDVYNMPIWLRRFTFNKINNFYADEKEQYENTQSGNKGSKNLVDPSGKVNTPDFAQASKQYKKSSSYK